MEPHSQYPGVPGGNFLIYQIDERTLNGWHYDFACAEYRLRPPLMGGAAVCDTDLLRLMQSSFSAKTPFVKAVEMVVPAGEKTSASGSTSISSIHDRKGYVIPNFLFGEEPSQSLSKTTSSASTITMASVCSSPGPVRNAEMPLKVRTEASDSESDVDCTDRRLRKSKSVQSGLFCVCVGSAEYLGEKIVADICSFKKRFKYLPRTTKSCIGKWLVLRVSSSSPGEKENKGSAWAAIEIGERVDDPRVYLPEYGWREDRGWGAFPILKVRVFKQMKVSQWGQGRPYALAVGDEAVELQTR